MYLGSKRSRGSTDPTWSGKTDRSLKDMSTDRYYMVIADLNIVTTDLPQFAKPEVVWNDTQY